nr:DnaA/Hda family protein [Neisseria sp. HSC-16F19]
MLLDLNHPHYPEFGRFLGEANAELRHVLHHEAAPFVYVWGPEGCGKGYLLRAWITRAQEYGAQAEYIDARLRSLPAWNVLPDCLAIHQAEHLDADGQARLFTLLNDFRSSGRGRLLVSAEMPPAEMPLREDVRTRLAMSLIYELKPLSDAEKISALAAMVEARQLSVDTEVFHYLLTHWRRDLDSLLDMLAKLEHHAMVHKRRISTALLREVFKQEIAALQESI